MPSSSSADEQERRYVELHPTSRQLYGRAVGLFPDGVTHDGRRFKPFPVYVTHAKGSRKWDVDGNEYVDYWMGHGALLLGHCHPEVTRAVLDQAARGTHYGACHGLELEWAERVKALIPSAELVRFHSSGTEATLMALRLARAYTGRGRIIQLAGHFHGWHDYTIPGSGLPPYGRTGTSGIPSRTLETMLIVPPNNLEAVEQVLAKDGDVAGVIVATNETVNRPYLEGLRHLTRREGLVLIFDEVISGFRYAPGGAQQFFGVTPDLTALAKILAGGLPGGAVAGKREILEMIATRDDPEWNRLRKIPHPGTFNANPLSAAAGVAALKVLADGEPHRVADRRGEELQRGLNDIFEDRGVAAYAYGVSSLTKIAYFKQPLASEDAYWLTEGPRSFRDLRKIGEMSSGTASARMRMMLLNRGVDQMGHLFTSVAHTQEDVTKTIEAFDSALKLIADEDLVGKR